MRIANEPASESAPGTHRPPERPLFEPPRITRALEDVRLHEERGRAMDGSGYPRGLRGEEISIGGRILAAADAYDALTSRRAYRASVSSADTIELLRAQAGRLLDPAVFHALEQVVARGATLTFIDDADG